VAVVHYAWGWCWAPATGAPRLAGGVPREVEGFTGRSSWAPGGDLVAIAVKTGAGTHVYVVDVARGQSRDIGPGTMPAWRPGRENQAAGQISFLESY